MSRINTSSTPYLQDTRGEQEIDHEESSAIDGSRPQVLVAEFHDKYQMPNKLKAAEKATLDFERLSLRMSLIAEEVLELWQAVYGIKASNKLGQILSEIGKGSSANLIETADALADLVYVIYGLALEAGINLDKVLAEVHRSNLSKLDADGSVIKRDDGKILKGPNYTPPNLKPLLCSD